MLHDDLGVTTGDEPMGEAISLPLADVPLTELPPTQHAYKEWQDAYDFFNERLFSNALPLCLITLQRKSRTRGYFSRDRFVCRDGRTVDEIALNPQGFALSTPAGVLSTLAHEMVHAWRFRCCGDPCKPGYHDSKWADKMEEVGLMPTTTGLPGGRRVGQAVTHYVIEGGRFDMACAELLARGPFVSWFDRYTSTEFAEDYGRFNLSGLLGKAPGAPDDEGGDEGATEQGGAPQGAAVSPESGESLPSGEEGGVVATGPDPSTGHSESTEAGGDPSLNPSWLRPVEKKDGPQGSAGAGGSMIESKGLKALAKKTSALDPPGAKFKALLMTPTAAKAERRKSGYRSRYTCPGCSLHIWGKGGLKLRCMACEEDIVEDKEPAGENAGTDLSQQSAET